MTLRTKAKNQIINLPPQFQNLSSFQFGKLIIQLNISQLQQLNVQQFQFEFLGIKSASYFCNQGKKLYEFPIMTTLWQFYNYLKDMQSITLKLQSQNSSQLLTCTKKLQLLPSQKIINKSYVKGNFIANSVQLCDIYDQNQQNKGYVMFKVKLQFDEDIHRELIEVIDFQDILTSQNPQETFNKKEQFFTGIINEQKKLSIHSKNVTKFQISVNQQNMPNSQNILPYNMSVNKNYEEEQSRMIQDDIDRMIAQIQNKPYDSSRYLENSSQNQQNTQYSNINRFAQTQLNYATNQIQKNVPLSQSMAYDSRQNRFQQQNNSRFQQQLNRSYHKSKSPLNNKKYPPLPISNTQLLGNTQSFMANTMISSQSQRSLSPAPNKNRSLNKTQQIQLQKSMRNISMLSNGGSMINDQTSKGILKVQIHELLGQQLDSNECILRVFVNNDYEDIFTCRGFQQGQVIIYNQKVQLNDCQLYEIQKLRFQLQNWEGKCLYSANFSIQRLLNIPKLQGIFILNLHPHDQQFYGNQITVSQSVLKKIDKPHGQKSLRVTIGYTEQVEVIQIYLNLSKFSLNFNKCKYKIPFTKQTVQFDPTQTHVNIFPHSKTYPKLMIEFWEQKSIIGVSEVNLSNLKNITKNVLECNLQPVYLYDCIFPIKNILSQNQVGKFKLLVCCGNVRQVQHVLNKSMLNRTQSMMEISNSSVNKIPIQVQYDKKLGVFIKDRKVKQQIEIQVDANQLENSQKQTQFKISQNVHGVQQNDHEVSMMSENQFLQHPKTQKQQPNIIKETNFPKVYTNNLCQQQQIQDEDEDQNQQILQEMKKQKQEQKSVFRKKDKSKIQENLESKKSIQIEEKKPKVEKKLENLQSVICENIQECLSPLKENNFEFYQQLKKSCKPHLLFNFIDIDILIKFMIEIGVPKSYITKILQILQPQNGMLNFNLLNDLMISLQVEGQIKPNLIPNKLFVRMALQQYYHKSCLSVQQQEKQNNFENKTIDQTQWMSSRFLAQISTLDESIDFNQIKKLFSSLGLKISMNDYTVLKSFLQNEKEIKSFLFQLAESKAAYQRMVKSQTNIYEILKMTIIEEILKRKKQDQINKKYEQNILQKLYSRKLSSNDFNHQLTYNEQNLNSSRTSNFSQVKNQFKQTVLKYPKTNQYYFQNQDHKIDPKSKQNSQQCQIQDDDDFIISNLNSNTKKFDDPREKIEINQKNKINQKYEQLLSDEQFKQEIVNVKRFKQKAPQIYLSKSGQQQINYALKRKITIEGLQSCKTTYECQFDMELSSPFIKVIIQSPFQKKLFFKDTDDKNQQEFQLPQTNQAAEDQEIEGEIILCEISQKGQTLIAMARFLVIKGIKAVYALKTIKQQSFSGLVSITID